MNDMWFRVEDVTFLDKGPYTLSLERGECVALSGRSGIGKTQLFRAITDLIPARGEIFLDGHPRTGFSPAQWRRKVTMVPADSCWWYDRVGDHFPLPGQNSFFSESSKALGLDPQTFEWLVSRLSTGERQRLALLRALQNRPAVLLLDEPSSGLDACHTRLMEAFIEHYRLCHKTSVVWVSHDPEQLLRVASRKFIMEQNGLREQI